MPTAAKLAAAVIYAFLAYLAAGMMRQYFPPSTQFGIFSEVSAAIGLFAGWRVMGRLAGQGWVAAINNGLRTSVTIVFLALVIFSMEGMYQVAIRKMYDGPLEAMLGAVKIGAEYAAMLLQPDMLAVLILGGMGCGMLTEWVAKRWP